MLLQNRFQDDEQDMWLGSPVCEYEGTLATIGLVVPRLERRPFVVASKDGKRLRPAPTAGTTQSLDCPSEKSILKENRLQPFRLQTVILTTPPGTRTPDPLIKSQLLCQLS